MTSTARDVMTEGAQCVSENDTVATAAQQMASLDVGALPICGEDDRLKGMLTDRDIVTKVVATGQDPDEVTVGTLADGGEVVTIGADDFILHVAARDTDDLRSFVVENLNADADVAGTQTSLIFEHLRGASPL